MLDRHFVKQNSEDTLLHLTRILGTQNNHLLVRKVDRDRRSRRHPRRESIRRKRTGIINRIVRFEMLQLLSRRTNKHIPHEQGMVSSGADDSNIDPVSFIPACESIDDIDAIASIQVVDSSFPVDLPDLQHTHQRLAR